MAIHPTANASLPPQVQMFASESRTAGRAVSSRETVAGEMAPHMDHDLSFDDVLEAVNPLNHIPVVSGFNDTSDNPLMTPMRLIGGFFTSGPIGMVTGMFNTIFSASGGAEDVANSLTSAFSKNSSGITMAL